MGFRADQKGTPVPGDFVHELYRIVSLRALAFICFGRLVDDVPFLWPFLRPAHLHINNILSDLWDYNQSPGEGVATEYSGGWAALLDLHMPPVAVNSSSGALRHWDGVCAQTSGGEESAEGELGQDHLMQRRCAVAHLAQHITSDAGWNGDMSRQRLTTLTTINPLHSIMATVH